MTQKERHNREQAFLHLGDSLVHIQDTKRLATTIDILASYAPNYFWTFPASTTGKYHPPKAREKHGLLWHVNHAVAWGLRLVERHRDEIPAFDTLRDSVVQALILHDLWKNGRSEVRLCDSNWPKGPTGITGTHGGLLADFLREKHSHEIDKAVARAIGGHMGPWTTAPHRHYWVNRGTRPPMHLTIIETVQLADYCAAQHFEVNYEG